MARSAPPTANDLSESLDQASRELRAAVIAGDHAGAERAVLNYVGLVQQFWDALPDAERSSSTLPVRVRELLSWAREMTIIQRALTDDQLRILQKASRYTGAPTSRAMLQVRA
jgi:hypothetical protein